jgi:NAD(P)H-dependent flavin oxidoreductase YrpB (nitropropane dioxygenase family)
MRTAPPLVLGRHTVPFPLIQGGMGVRVSAGSLAGAVARCGGVGLVATAGIGFGKGLPRGERLADANEIATREEVLKAVRLSGGGVVGINCMVAARWMDRVVPAACDAGAKVVVCGAGLPLALPDLVKSHPDVALVPIVSSERAARVIARRWERSHGRLPDAVVVEDPDTAGGHLGAPAGEIGTGAYDHYGTVRAVRAMFREEFGTPVPVVAAGGVWGCAEFWRALDEGADAVQMATRFVVTEECDAAPAFKQAYIDARKEDIGLVHSPVGMPGRALSGNAARIRRHDLDRNFRCSVACLEECGYRDHGSEFCIMEALARAQAGDVETGLVFCGTNAWRAERIGTVREVFEEIFGAEACAAAGTG